MSQPLTEQQLDEIEAVVRNAPLVGADIDPGTAAALLAEVRRQRAELAAVAAFLDEQELAARAFELPTPAWVEAVRALSAPPVAPLAASQPSEAPVEGETAAEGAAGRAGDSGAGSSGGAR